METVNTEPLVTVHKNMNEGHVIRSSGSRLKTNQRINLTHHIIKLLQSLLQVLKKLNITKDVKKGSQINPWLLNTAQLYPPS